MKLKINHSISLFVCLALLHGIWGYQKPTQAQQSNTPPITPEDNRISYSPALGISSVQIESIRRVAEAEILQGDPGVEIVLSNTCPFLVGGLDCVLQIGNYQLWPSGRSANLHTLTYTFTLEQWDNLNDGDPIALFWGQVSREPSAISKSACMTCKNFLVLHKLTNSSYSLLLTANS